MCKGRILFIPNVSQKKEKVAHCKILKVAQNAVGKPPHKCSACVGVSTFGNKPQQSFAEQFKPDARASSKMGATKKFAQDEVSTHANLNHHPSTFAHLCRPVCQTWTANIGVNQYEQRQCKR